MDERKGWYSSKYDSTKQLSVMCGKGGDIKYRTSLRFEMLLGGMVVITDSQWYDGLFFSKMATENDGKELKEFIEFALYGLNNGGSDLVPFTIRRRDEYVYRMFGKAFLFSSVSNAEVRTYIQNIWEGCTEEIKPICATIESYLNYVDFKIKASRFEHSAEEKFESFKKGLAALDKVDERLFISWNKSNYMQSCIGEVKTKLIELLDSLSLSYFSDEIKIIKYQLEQPYPNRSIIKYNIDRIRNNGDVGDVCNRFMHIFEDKYNNAIALQHECRYYDLYDAVSASEGDENTCIKVDTMKFPAPILDYLGAMTWEEFGRIYYDEQIVEKRKKWLSDFDSGKEEEIKRSFSDYVDCIMKKVNKIGIWVMEESIFYRASGTERVFDSEYLGKMIGGAASDNLLDANEICFYLNDQLSKSDENRILRYGSTEAASQWYDTVFAPIESIIKKRGK